MSQVWGLKLPDSEMLILLALADWSNDDGDCWPSIAQLRAKTNKSERTIQGAIKSMVAAGHMSRDEVPGRGCRYRIHPRSDCTPAATAPRTKCTPAKSAPPQRTTDTPAAAADNTSVHIIPQKTSSSSVARASKPLGFHRMPDGWKPTLPFPASLQAKLDDWPPGKLDDELDALRAWAVNAKNEQGKGRKLDWDQAAHNWLRKADDEWRSRNGPRNGIVALAGNRPGPASGYGLTTDAGFAFISDGGPH